MITTPQVGAANSVDMIVIVGDYAPTPVRGIFRASREFSTPVVLIAGLQEMDADNLVRKLAEGRRVSRKPGSGVTPLTLGDKACNQRSGILQRPEGRKASYRLYGSVH